ncbi:MAG: hypothetical protein R8K22_02185 [Mariprofundaceae bacterium]
MITNRLTESVLFLETSCKCDADKEYSSSIHRLIQEHSLLREAMEKISVENDVPRILEIARSAITKTEYINTQKNSSLYNTLTNLSQLLPSDEQLEKMITAKSLIKKALG